MAWREIQRRSQGDGPAQYRTDSNSLVWPISASSDTPVGFPARGLLLATKLHRPPALASLVVRPRLGKLLDQAMHCTLTLVTAPAGFGKTTLVSEWVRLHNRPSAWVSLDPGDNDPTRFWSYVFAALDSLQPDSASMALAILQLPQTVPLESVLTLVLNALAGTQHEAFLVLDDYHTITSPEIHQTMTYFVEHLPAHVHIILTSRGEPSLPLPRLRARGQLQEIGIAELRFLADEATSFLNHVMGLHLSDEQIASLAERTEGWIAGLQLSAVSLRKSGDIAGLIKNVVGTQRYVLDYLAEEVLDQQPPEIREFLLHTCLLDRLTAPLCNVVTERTDSQDMLESLERAGLFVVALDEQRIWYRYHHLFAEFLQSRLHREGGQLIPQLRQRASLWCADNGLLDEAIAYALAGPHISLSVDLIERAASARLLKGETATLQQWLKALPAEVLRERPRLCLAQAWIHLISFNIGQADVYADQAEQGISGVVADEQGVLRHELAAIRTTAAALQADVTRIGELKQHVEEAAIHVASPFLRGMAELNMALTYELRGDTVAASRAYLEASTSSQATGNISIAILALSQLCDQLILQGQLRRAAETCRQVLRMVPDQEGALPVGSPLVLLAKIQAHFGLSMILYEWNDLAGVQEQLPTALSYLRGDTNPMLQAIERIAAARLYQAIGDYSATLTALNEGDRLLNDVPLLSSPLVASYLTALRARCLLQSGDLSGAGQWAERYQAEVSLRPSNFLSLPPIDLLEKGTLLRVLLAQNRIAEALELADQLCDETEKNGLGGALVEYLLLRAMAQHEAGQGAAALESLARSLALAAPEGYMRLYIDAGQLSAQLIDQLAAGAVVSSPVPPIYLKQVQAACHTGHSPKLATDLDIVATASLSRSLTTAAPPLSPPTTPSAGSDLIEPLSQREREVLQLIAEGLSNQDIARTLVVEVSTVKTHLLRLYGKLGVHSRTQAMNRAAELHLL